MRAAQQQGLTEGSQYLLLTRKPRMLRVSNSAHRQSRCSIIWNPGFDCPAIKPPHFTRQERRHLPIVDFLDRSEEICLNLDG